MSSMINGIQTNTTTSSQRNVTDLTDDQKNILKNSKLDPESTEYKSLSLKMQLGNLDSANTMAKELADALKKMRDTAIQGMGR
jgi:hypothetical protein